MLSVVVVRNSLTLPGDNLGGCLPRPWNRKVYQGFGSRVQGRDELWG